MLFSLLHLLLALQTHVFPAARARNDRLQFIWAENEGAEFWCDFLVLCRAEAPVAGVVGGTTAFPDPQRFGSSPTLSPGFGPQPPKDLSDMSVP